MSSTNEKLVYKYLYINTFEFNPRIQEKVKIFYDDDFYIYKYGVKTLIDLSKYSSKYPNISRIDCKSVVTETVYDKYFDDDCVTSNISLSEDDDDTYTMNDAYNEHMFL